MKKCLTAAAVTLAALSAQPALAADSVSQPLTFTYNGTDVSNGSAGFSITHQVGGVFTDLILFSLPELMVGNGLVSTLSIGLQSNIDFDCASCGISLSGGSLGEAIYFRLFDSDTGQGGAEIYQTSVLSLGAGEYTIRVQGDARTTPATYTGQMNLSAVPEPATWALMLLGFGAVGYSLRRRNKSVGYRLQQAV